MENAELYEEEKDDSGRNYPPDSSSQGASPKDFQYFVGLLGSEEVSGKEKGLAINIPFCDSICTFCDAYRIIKKKDKIAQYLQALKAEMKMYAETKYIDSSIFSSLYFAGGTPTVLSSEQLCDIISYCKARFALSEDAEILVTSTTHNVSENKIRELLDCGVNRLYFGVQTFDDSIRKLLNRVDSKRGVIQTIETAHKLGCENVHVDLMFNLPGQTIEMWKHDLNIAIDLEVESITAIQLYVHPHLKLAAMLKSGAAPPVGGADTAVAMYNEAADTLKGAGYDKEKGLGPESAFVLPGKETKYAGLYRDQRDMLVLGAVDFASATLGKYRYRNIKSIEHYAESVSSGKFPIAEGVKLSKENEMRGTLLVGLDSGIEKQEFKKRFGMMPEDVVPEMIDTLLKKDLIMVNEQVIKLTDTSVMRYIETYEILQSFLCPVMD